MSSRAAFPRLRGLTPARRRGGPEPAGSPSGSSSPSGSLQKGGNRFRSRCRHPRTQQVGPTVTMYQVTDLLHAEHSLTCLVMTSRPPYPRGWRSWAPIPRWLTTSRERYAPATGPPLMPSAIACPSMCPLRHEPPRGDRATNHVSGQAISIPDETIRSAPKLAGDRAPRRGVRVMTRAASRFTPTEGERPG